MQTEAALSEFVLEERPKVKLRVLNHWDNLDRHVERGYAGDPGRTEGRVVVTARRIVGRLHVVVEDDGRGLPDSFDLDASTQLGLSIVRTLVESELGGVLEIGPGSRGTRVQADLPVE